MSRAVALACALSAVSCKPTMPASQTLDSQSNEEGVAHSFVVQTKGFIAPIHKIGTLNGLTSYVKLRSFAEFTNVSFSENPPDGTRESEQYRLWAELRVTAVCSGGQLSRFTVDGHDSDAGFEPSSPRLRAVALRAETDALLVKTDRHGRFYFGAAGRPPIQSEPVFQAIGKRRNTTIWYTVEGYVQCTANNDAVINIPRNNVRVTLFPTTRLWVSKTSPRGFESYQQSLLHEWKQDEFTYLWRLPDVPGYVPQWPLNDPPGRKAQNQAANCGDNGFFGLQGDGATCTAEDRIDVAPPAQTPESAAEMSMQDFCAAVYPAAYDANMPEVKDLRSACLAQP